MLVRPVSDVCELVTLQTVVPRLTALTYTRGTAIIMPYVYLTKMLGKFSKIPKNLHVLAQNALGELHTR